MKRVLVVPFVVVLLSLFIVPVCLASEVSAIQEALYDPLIEVCEMMGITVTPSDFSVTENGVKQKAQAQITDGVIFNAFYDDGDLTSCSVTASADSYGMEHFTTIAPLFIIVADPTKDEEAARNIIVTMTETATEDLLGMISATYSSDIYDFSLTSLQGDITISVKQKE